MTEPTSRERDPHFRKIVEGLDGPLNRDLLEECVQDLLRQDYPGLTGVYGGSDGGMDGAIPDGEGEPFALVVTTAENVIQNLGRSLDRRIEEGDLRRKAVLATSQALTPRREKNLKRRAREKGFVLLQIFERRDIASRLYRDSKWTKLLLDITGEPSALSAVPKTRRPLLDVDLVGRAEDLAWLRETTGDRLLVGEPGSGKTSLLLQLVEDGTALFLSDIEGFASAYRDFGPEIVLVDDAHVEPERLDRLRQIRKEIHAENSFSIVATSWKGDRDEVMNALEISGKKVRTLELLTRSEIVEVYRQVGIDLPAYNSYLADLVTQAANRPGLAVTLGRAWLMGNYDEVLTGEAIYRSVVPFLKRTLDHDPEQGLAAFALGGDRGMGLSAVAAFLGEPPGRVRDMAARVGASGILKVRGKDEQGEVVLAVNPPQLRVPLVDKIFFGEFPLPWHGLVQQARSLESVVDTLVLASLRGVLVPRGDVQELLKEAGPRADWGEYALLGANEAEWVFHNYPGSITDIAPHALRSAPRMAIRTLLLKAEKAAEVPDSSTTEALRVLREWSKEVLPRSEETLERRRLLIDEALKYLQYGGDGKVALVTAFFALSPRLESSRLSATGDSLIMRNGSLLISAAPVMLHLWDKVRDALPRMDREAWHELNNTLHWWIHPNTKVGEEDLESFNDVARQILIDLVPLAEGRLGLTAALLWRAQQVNLELALSSDPVFDILHRDIYQDPRGWRLARQEAEEEARRLAREWATRPISEVVDDLDRYREEAKWISGGRSDTFEFHLALSEAASAPEDWLKTLLEAGSEAGLVQDFLARVVQEQRPGWEELLIQALNDQRYSWAAVRQVLRLPGPSEELLERALTIVEPQLVETVCLQGDVPTETLGRLLSAEDPRIALAAAIGEWLSDPEGTVRIELQSLWRESILDPGVLAADAFPMEKHWLGVILARDQDLAHDWIKSQVSEQESSLLLSTIESSPFSVAARSLDESRRARLLQELPEEHLRESLVRPLVAKSSELYSMLLERTERTALQVAPLADSPPDEDWVRLALVALDHGVDPRPIAAEAFWQIGPYTPSAEHWRPWLEAFRNLEDSSQPGLREVARHGLKMAEERVEKAKAGKRQFELTGGR